MKICNFEFSARLPLVEVIFGPHGLYFLVKLPYMGRTDHILMVEIPYMGPTGPQYISGKGSLYMNLQSVYFWKRVLIYEPSVSIILERVLIAQVSQSVYFW